MKSQETTTHITWNIHTQKLWVECALNYEYTMLQWLHMITKTPQPLVGKENWYMDCPKIVYNTFNTVNYKYEDVVQKCMRVNEITHNQSHNV